MVIYEYEIRVLYIMVLQFLIYTFILTFFLLHQHSIKKKILSVCTEQYSLNILIDSPHDQSIQSSSLKEKKID